MSVTSKTQIDGFLPAAGLIDARERAESAFAARRKSWEHADERLGYPSAREEEIAAAAEEAALVTKLWRTPTRSVCGVIATLHAIVETHDFGSRLNEPP